VGTAPVQPATAREPFPKTLSTPGQNFWKRGGQNMRNRQAMAVPAERRSSRVVSSIADRMVGLLGGRRGSGSLNPGASILLNPCPAPHAQATRLRRGSQRFAHLPVSQSAPVASHGVRRLPLAPLCCLCVRVLPSLICVHPCPSVVPPPCASPAPREAKAASSRRSPYPPRRYVAGWRRAARREPRPPLLSAFICVHLRFHPLPLLCCLCSPPRPLRKTPAFLPSLALMGLPQYARCV